MPISFPAHSLEEKEEKFSLSLESYYAGSGMGGPCNFHFDILLKSCSQVNPQSVLPQIELESILPKITFEYRLFPVRNIVNVDPMRTSVQFLLPDIACTPPYQLQSESI